MGISNNVLSVGSVALGASVIGDTLGVAVDASVVGATLDVAVGALVIKVFDIFELFAYFAFHPKAFSVILRVTSQFTFPCPSLYQKSRF